MTYDQQILQLLSAAGQRGISVQALSKHVYNMNATFFAQPDLEELRAYIQQFLLRNSKSEQSLIERTDRRGHYRLNTARNADARQLALAFQPHPSDTDDTDADQADSPAQDLSLSLF